MWPDVFALSTRGKILNVKAFLFMLCLVVNSNVANYKLDKDTRWQRYTGILLQGKVVFRFSWKNGRRPWLLLPPKCKTFKDEIFIFEESRFSAICSALYKRFVFVLCHCRFQFP